MCQHISIIAKHQLTSTQRSVCVSPVALKVRYQLLEMQRVDSTKISPFGAQKGAIYYRNGKLTVCDEAGQMTEPTDMPPVWKCRSGFLRCYTWS